MEYYKRVIHTDRIKEYEIYLLKKTNVDFYTFVTSGIHFEKIMLVTTPTVYKLYKQTIFSESVIKKINGSLLVITCKHEKKTFDCVSDVCRYAESIKLGKNGILIAVGGGNCTDIVTLAASMLMRGIRYIKVPTTLVGQIDAGIGIKGAVNFYSKKNYLGCFYPPESVFLFPFFLQTVPPHLIRQGIAEIIKIAIIEGGELFSLLEMHSNSIDILFSDPYGDTVLELLEKSLCLMMRKLETDLYEMNSHKRKLDLGHTFSPEIEAISQYRISHGDAVSIDIALSTMISRKLNFIDSSECERIISLLLAIELPVYCNELSVSACFRAIEYSIQRRSGKLNLVVPAMFGKTEFIENQHIVTTSILEESIQMLQMYSVRDVA